MAPPTVTRAALRPDPYPWTEPVEVTTGLPWDRLADDDFAGHTKRLLSGCLEVELATSYLCTSCLMVTLYVTNIW
jgi:hypothetical protein